GSIARLREQSRRLFTTSVSCLYDGQGATGETGFRIADRHKSWLGFFGQGDKWKDCCTFP
ncbi:MAG: hypothetical protein ACREQ5_14925, partial [Candidatus Dormibacteria bacterium]